MQNQNRRNFLKSSGVFSATALVSPMINLLPADASANDQVKARQPKEKTRTLGKGPHSLNINLGMGLGCMGMSFNRSFIPDRNNSIAVIRKAYEMGVNFFDSAEAYGPFTNEVLVG